MARSEVERAASPFYVEPAGGRLYIPTDYLGTVSEQSGIENCPLPEINQPACFPHRLLILRRTGTCLLSETCQNPCSQRRPSILHGACTYAIGNAISALNQSIAA